MPFWIPAALAGVQALSGMMGAKDSASRARDAAEEQMQIRNVPFWSKRERVGKDIIGALSGQYNGAPTDSIPDIQNLRGKFDVLSGGPSGSTAAALRAAPQVAAAENTYSRAGKAFNTREGLAMEDWVNKLHLAKQRERTAFEQWKASGDLAALREAQAANEEAQRMAMEAVGGAGAAMGQAWGSRTPGFKPFGAGVGGF